MKEKNRKSRSLRRSLATSPNFVVFQSTLAGLVGWIIVPCFSAPAAYEHRQVTVVTP